MEDLKKILTEHPFFKGLEEEYFALIVGCASNVRIDAGKMIHREGESLLPHSFGKGNTPIDDAQ